MTHLPKQTREDSRGSAIVGQLIAEEWMLVRLRDQLYEGSWAEMRQDLEDRLNGKPYIFKLVNRIQDDLRRIARLEDLETTRRMNLGDYLPGHADGA